MCLAPRYMSGMKCTPSMRSRYAASPPSTPCAKASGANSASSRERTCFSISLAPGCRAGLAGDSVVDDLFVVAVDCELDRHRLFAEVKPIPAMLTVEWRDQ